MPKNWTREELLLALDLYLPTPFGKQHKTHPPIIELAKKLGRTAGSVAMKLNNLTSLDPTERERGVRGLSGASNLDKAIWAEYQDNRFELIVEMEQALESLHDETPKIPDSLEELDDVQDFETEAEAVVNIRRGQNFFRRTVLANYNNRCCITGNCIPEMLRASLIIPWQASKEHRLNPTNGLCLTADFDAAFDRGLISIDGDYKLVISPRLDQHESNEHIQKNILARKNQPIRIPEKNLPSTDSLTWHFENLFQAES